MWLEHYRTFWDARLAALEAFLLKKERGAGSEQADILGRMAMTVTDEAAPVLVVRRQMAVPRERVFEAWLDSESLAHWMRPGNITHATVTVDPRVGGGFRIVMEGRPHGVRRAPGEYLAIEPPSLLSFTWISEAHRPPADGRHHRVPRAGHGNRAGPHPSAPAAEGGRGAPEGVDRHRAPARREPGRLDGRGTGLQPSRGPSHHSSTLRGAGRQAASPAGAPARESPHAPVPSAPSTRRLPWAPASS